MARRPRPQFEGATYHVYTRGNRKSDVYLDDSDYRAYLEDVRELADHHRVEVLAFCLMPNHPHLALRTQGDGISVFMQRLTQRHAVRFNRKYGVSGQLMEGRYKSLLIHDATYL